MRSLSVFNIVARSMAVLSVLLVFRVQAEDRRSDPSSLTIMTYNAEFLWDGEEPEEGNIEFDWKSSKDEAGEHMAKIAEVVRRVNPDILHLVEVENLSALKRLNAGYLQGFGYEAYLVDGKDTATGQDVGLLTRIDPEEFSRTDAKGQSGAVVKTVSKNYIARFHINGEAVAVIGVHLLAFPNDAKRVVERQAQADVIQNEARALIGQGYAVVVLGDFNDYDGAEDAIDHLGSQPKSKVLSAIRALDPATSDDNLVNAASFLPSARRYTAWYDKNQDHEAQPDEFTSIDHILLPQALKTRVMRVDAIQDYNPAAVSDHYPLFVRIKLGGSATAGPESSVRIFSLLPNPEGSDDKNEEITLINPGQPASLQGWKLRDLSGKTWSLSGNIAGGDKKTIRRNGTGMVLNNDGDTVELMDPSGKVICTVTYPAVEVGETYEIAP